jgi:hypothetical protein
MKEGDPGLNRLKGYVNKIVFENGDSFARRGFTLTAIAILASIAVAKGAKIIEDRKNRVNN